MEMVAQQAEEDALDAPSTVIPIITTEDLFHEIVSENMWKRHYVLLMSLLLGMLVGMAAALYLQHHLKDTVVVPHETLQQIQERKKQ